MEIVLTLVIGGVVGWIVSLASGADDATGLAASVLIGVIGSVLGLWLAGLAGLALAANPARWLVSMLGAIALVAIVRALGLVRPRTV